MKCKPYIPSRIYEELTNKNTNIKQKLHCVSPVSSISPILSVTKVGITIGLLFFTFSYLKKL